MRYQILDEAGTVINTIIADADFMQQNYPSANYRLEVLPDTSAPPA